MKLKNYIFVCFHFVMVSMVYAQTESDGIFMGKKNLCGGFIYGYSSWNEYWEGTFLRKNDNIGTIQSNNVTGMINYGISSTFNVISSISYVKNEASAGTLISQSGLQDFQLFLKKSILNRTIKSVESSITLVGGVSVPLTNYVADYFPLSIGFQSKTATARLIIDLQKDKFYLTTSSSITSRSNVIIDRNSYYTTELIYSNEVKLPKVLMNQFRLGYRYDYDRYVELIFDAFQCTDGFDIRKNDMPFLSNKMEQSRLGINFKYALPKTNGLSIVGNGFHTIAGRNMGKSNSVSLGLVYQHEFSK